MLRETGSIENKSELLNRRMFLFGGLKLAVFIAITVRLFLTSKLILQLIPTQMAYPQENQMSDVTRSG